MKGWDRDDAMTDLELLEELKKIDTPTVTNVVATYPGRPEKAYP